MSFESGTRTTVNYFETVGTRRNYGITDISVVRVSTIRSVAALCTWRVDIVENCEVDAELFKHPHQYQDCRFPASTKDQRTTLYWIVEWRIQHHFCECGKFRVTLDNYDTR